MDKSKILLGCVADDFTGASDAASFLRSSGLRVAMCTGVPEGELWPSDCDALVIALKCRSTPAQEAVRDCTEAFKWLLAAGAGQLYYKYCSTFDSTPEGNIGPVLDAALELLGEKYTLLCPSLPVNGRTVHNGRLYVDGVPLAMTHMKNHPVNPMWASDIPVLMREQSKYPCYVLSEAEMSMGKEHIAELIKRLPTENEHFYLVPDYFKPEHNELIYSLFGGAKLLSGGSGLLAAVNAEKVKSSSTQVRRDKPGKTILLAGSCSSMTLKQVAEYKSNAAAIKIDPLKVLSGSQNCDTLWDELAGRSNVLLYSSESADEIARIPSELRPRVSDSLERLTAELAQRAVQSGYTQIIVAGGETSGAVTTALGYGMYLIGDSVAPGVPVLAPADAPDMRLVLKSGNFGKEDFFNAAIEMTTADNCGRPIS